MPENPAESPQEHARSVTKVKLRMAKVLGTQPDSVELSAAPHGHRIDCNKPHGSSRHNVSLPVNSHSIVFPDLRANRSSTAAPISLFPCSYFESCPWLTASARANCVFARIINVSPNAVESWEQGVRHPREATLKLLTIAHKYPEVLLSGD